MGYELTFAPIDRAGCREKPALDGLRSFIGEEGELPYPGGGETWRRLQVLSSYAAQDLSVGRLVEGHADAAAILAEAGSKPRPEGVTYGVWAARQAHGGTMATPVDGGWKLSGTKPFCSGSITLDRALVTAEAPDGYRLFEISVADQVVARDERSWPAVGMAASMSETLSFGGPPLSSEASVGPPGFYTDRPGFWFGAVGVAACWYGGAIGLVDSLLGAAQGSANDHVMAEVGRAKALVVAMGQTLRWAAEGMDADPGDEHGHGHERALVTRQVVHDGCVQVLSAVASGGGARPLSHDPAQARRMADLVVYLAQHHGNSDAAELGRIALGRHE